MSRVGKLPISVPSGVTVTLEDDIITVTGPKGSLASHLPASLEIEIDPQIVRVKRKDESNRARALQGLTRALVYNMVHGVSQGFSVVLEIQGTGYRARCKTMCLTST